MADNNKKHIIVCGKGGGGSGTQVQADWNETDSTSPAYINNKPNALPTQWWGTQQEYDAIPVKDPDTIYNIAGDGTTDWWGTQAEYDLIDPKDPNTVYHIEGNGTVDWDDVENKPTFATVATSGDYTDLSNTPTIPTNTSDLNNNSGYITISDVPAQVNADWNANSGVAEILNKPTIPVVPPMTTETLTFTLSDQSTVTLTVYVQPVLNYFYVEDASGSDNTLTIHQGDPGSSPAFEVFKSSDQVNWTSMGVTGSTDLTATVPANGKLYLKANTYGWSNDIGQRNEMNCSANFNVGGNIMSLLVGDNYSGATLDSNYTTQFYYLFEGSNVVDASDLELPSNTTGHCYQGMFWQCTSLTTAPVLPATTLADWCYMSMFTRCTSLTATPTFVASALGEGSYFAMFEGCSSLTTVAALPNGSWNSYDSPYRYMFTTCPLIDSITTYFTGDYTTYLEGWLTDVAQTGDFFNLGGATFAAGADGIPTGWTEHNSI